jgi:hypothetical protein
MTKHLSKETWDKIREVVLGGSWFFKETNVMKLLIKEEDDMSKNKGRRDISPGKKPGPLTKKERKERKKKRKEKHV